MEQLRQWTDDEMFKPHQLVRAYYHKENFDYMTMHTHNFYELNIVMSGNGKHFLNNSTFHITSGDIFIMPPNVSHGYDFDSKTYSIFHLLFNKQFFVKAFAFFLCPFLPVRYCTHIQGLFCLCDNFYNILFDTPCVFLSFRFRSFIRPHFRFS